MKKLATAIKLLTASTIGFGIISSASAAHAGSFVSLVPDREGEIKLDGIDCLDPLQCIDDTKSKLGYTVESLEFDPNFGKSRLFADKRSTPSTVSGITFNNPDAGTNAGEEEIWLRPIAFTKDGEPFENGGQLEAGKFKFDFLGKSINKLFFDFLDVEDSDISGIIEAWDKNGNSITVPSLLKAGGNNAVQSLELHNVSKFTIQLGNPGPNSVFNKTGDGVLLRMARTPEPGTVFSLGALAVAGALGVSKRKKTAAN